MIDPEALPDPRVVVGLEVNKLPADPLLLARLMVERGVSFLHVGSQEDGERMCEFAVWYSGDTQDARVRRLGR